MSPKMRPKITQVYLCDNAFQDTKNKWNLIGIYSGDVLVEKFPARLRTALYVEIEMYDSIALSLELYLGKRKVATVSAKVDSTDGAQRGTGVLAVPAIEFGVDKPVEFRVVGKIDDLATRTVFRKQILLLQG